MSTLARWTLDEYDRMIAAGLFDAPQRRRVELIAGEIRAMSPVGPLHHEVVMRLEEWSHDQLPRAEGRVSIQGPVRLPAQGSAPEPDVTWLVRRDYTHESPAAADVLLLIEVADTSLDYDTGEKADLYAAAGIADYWVVDLHSRLVEVRREPLDGRYRQLQAFRGDDLVRPLCRPAAALPPAALFAGG